MRSAAAPGSSSPSSPCNSSSKKQSTAVYRALLHEFLNWMRCHP
jgi:hypothetical protein